MGAGAGAVAAVAAAAAAVAAVAPMAVCEVSCLSTLLFTAAGAQLQCVCVSVCVCVAQRLGRLLQPASTLFLLVVSWVCLPACWCAFLCGHSLRAAGAAQLCRTSASHWGCMPRSLLNLAAGRASRWLFLGSSLCARN